MIFNILHHHKSIQVASGGGFTSWDDMSHERRYTAGMGVG
jgi:hypothetical protein